MSELALGSIITDLGLGNALAIVICIIFFFLLKWVLKSATEARKEAKEERQAWQALIHKFNDKYDKVTDKMEEHEKAAKERGIYIKQEHQSLLKAMQEVEQALGRINGYKKD